MNNTGVGQLESVRSSEIGGRSITLSQVSKVYGNVPAVMPLDLHIAEGEFVTLLGPSGCGKSTTLNLVAGLEFSDDGEILFGKRDVTRLPPQERNVAMVFQSYALYPHMTVRENVSFPLRRRGLGMSQDAIRDRVSRITTTLGLEKLLDRTPGELSGGQRQRVAVGRALVREPFVFLMDEPLSNLDNQLRVQMRTEIGETHRRFGITTVYVTHDQGEAMVLSDRIVLMKDGVVQQVGTPADVYRKPANHFVAGFMGDRGMNVVPVTLYSGGVHLTTGQPAAVALKDVPGNASGARTIGLWPEELRVTAGNDDAACRGEVRAVEYLGGVHMALVDLGNQVLVWISGSSVKGSAVGQRVGVVAEPGSLVSLFDVDGKSVGSCYVGETSS
jgi:ABC-type sugar transport system ATPase subunit